MTHKDLENVLVRLTRELGAKGIIMIILPPGDKRAEIVAALKEEIDDLPKLLQQLADQCKDGDYYPLGGHGTKRGGN